MTAIKNTAQLLSAFIDHNMTGGGRSAAAKGSYWYRGTVLYYNQTPSWRFIDGVKGTKVMLVKHLGYAPPKQDPYKGRMKARSVPDIGVFSHFEGDMLPDNQVLDRVRYIMLSQVRELVYETMPKINADQLESYKADDLRKTLKEMYKRYNDLRVATGCGWNDMPTIYIEQLEDGMKQKIDAYNDPAAVKARERSAARKLAVKALVGDAKKVA